VGVLFVFLGVDLGDGVEDPFAVRRESGRSDALEAGEVIERDSALFGSVGGKGEVERGTGKEQGNKGLPESRGHGRKLIKRVMSPV
jgi:hypothetical protein